MVTQPIKGSVKPNAKKMFFTMKCSILKYDISSRLPSTSRKAYFFGNIELELGTLGLLFDEILLRC